MKVYRSLAELPANFGPSVAVIGNFDGVHRGHQHLLAAALADARHRHARAIAITFDPHPEHFLRPAQAPGLLTLIPERLRLLAATGIDATLVLPFDAALADLSALDFVQQILERRLGVLALHEGRNFRFGHRAEAGITELAAYGHQFGFHLNIHAPLTTHGLEISSSATRTHVAAGHLRQARWMLGHPFQIVSTSVRDRGIGSRLLVPTINLAPYPGLLPAPGVYITRMTIGDGSETSLEIARENGLHSAPTFQAITNIGHRPTFADAGFAVETHLLNYHPTPGNELTLTPETPLRLSFLHRLRDERRFPTPEALKTQIGQDIRQALRFHHLSGLVSPGLVSPGLVSPGLVSD